MTYVTAAGKNTDIEVLRGFAILFVIVHHVSPLLGDTFPIAKRFFLHFSFWSGVDLFFAISGFVITLSLRDVFSADRSHRILLLKRYAIKRVFRLMPAAWLWLIIPLLVAAVMDGRNGFPPFHTLKNDAFAALLNIANIYYPWCVSHGEVGTLCSSSLPLGPYWSLSLEEQFYFVLPLLFLLLTKRSIKILFALVLLVLLFLQRPVFSFAWYNRADGLLWGVLLAFMSIDGARLLIPARMLNVVMLRLMPAALLALLAAIAAFDNILLPVEFTFLYAPGLLAFVSAMLVYLASLNRGLISSDGVVRRCLVFIGARSYALYLVHIPMLIVGSTLFGLPLRGDIKVIMSVASGLVMTFVAAEITYRLVEVPARNFGLKLARQVGTFP